MLIVKKFGGTSVGNKERILNVAKRCIEDYQKGNDVVVVLSAMGKSTDELINMAKDINPTPSKRELDMLVTTGEQVSVSLMAMAMGSLGVPAISLNAFQVAMHTTHRYGNAQLKRIDTDRIRNELEQRKIVLVTGFQGIDKFDNVTTLGRGGSDTTAVALSAELNASKCYIYSDVDGIYTADPRKIPNADKLTKISYEEMYSLSSEGAKVLHDRCVEIGEKFDVPIITESTFNDKKGTEITHNLESSGVKSIVKKEISKISVIGYGISSNDDILQKVLEIANEKKADVEIETVPGVTAASAAASVLGAPLMHDFTIISLSDLMTPYSLIMKRVDCAGQGDFIVCLYNPKSKKRADYVEKAAEILMKYRDGKTPVGIVRHAGREEESSYITTLDAVKDAPIDMFSIVIVGNSNTYVRDGKMITPRGYEDKYGFANVE